MADAVREDLLRKLELIKEVKSKMVHLEKLRVKVKSECDIMDNEDNYLQDYKTEMELLMQEKMAHVEELRLIHADINLMESTIKQSEEERAKALEKARMLFEEQRLLKEQLERLKTSVKVEEETEQTQPENEREATEDENLAVKLFETNKVSFSHYHQHLLHHQQQQQYLQMQQQQQQQFFSSTPSALSSSSSSDHNFNNSNNPSSNNPAINMPLSLLPLTQPGHHSLHLKASDHTHTPSDPIPNSSAAMAAFRQQPPPMKACLSCHQQIHRNAPICPLCKAKSRSRNPKKPKRKVDE